jgi:Ca-activated chloride channel family protein
VSSLLDFHFLRPVWLLAALPALVLLWRLWRQRSGAGWRRVIAPHLLTHLLAGEDDRAAFLGPLQLLAAFWVLATLAAAGPGWQREPAPFADERAPLVIALHVGPTMLAEDIQPNRLERATHKIRDLLERRAGARTALVAYAGSAHLVMPLTTDRELIARFASELSPAIMPQAGDDPAAAITLAQRVLDTAEQRGAVLLITDAVAADALENLPADTHADILAIAAPPGVEAPPSGPPAPALNRNGLARAARLLDGEVFEVSVDDSDVESLARRLEGRVGRGGVEEGQRWRDAGYYLLLPLALIVLATFRRGWVVRWQA